MVVDVSVQADAPPPDCGWSDERCIEGSTPAGYFAAPGGTCLGAYNIGDAMAALPGNPAPTCDECAAGSRSTFTAGPVTNFSQYPCVESPAMQLPVTDGTKLALITIGRVEHPDFFNCQTGVTAPSTAQGTMFLAMQNLFNRDECHPTVDKRYLPGTYRDLGHNTVVDGPATTRQAFRIELKKDVGLFVSTAPTTAGPFTPLLVVPYDDVPDSPFPLGPGAAFGLERSIATFFGVTLERSCDEVCIGAAPPPPSPPPTVPPPPPPANTTAAPTSTSSSIAGPPPPPSPLCSWVRKSPTNVPNYR